MNNKEIHNRIKNSKKEANKIWDELFYCEEIEVSTKKSNKKKCTQHSKERYTTCS